MPTGYTAPIADGITFEQYAMGCARAFGALVMMRDEPQSAPIPDRFEPSDYYAKALAESRSKLARLMSMTAKEIAEAAEADYQHQREQYEKCILDMLTLSGKYHAMLESVKRWTPPTEEHAPLKAFMVDQIEQSLRHDCNSKYEVKPERVPASEWMTNSIAEARRAIEYREKSHREEVERTEQRNQWLKALRDSLEPIK